MYRFPGSLVEIDGRYARQEMEAEGRYSTQSITLTLLTSVASCQFEIDGLYDEGESKAF